MKITQGTFSFLPELSDEEIDAQLRYAISHGWSLSIEYTDDPHPRNSYWEMWGLPRFDLTVDQSDVVLREVRAAREAFPEAYIKVILEEGIKVVETAGNNPGKYIKMFKDGGCTVIHKCVTIRHARTALKFGADIISMDGFGKPLSLNFFFIRNSKETNILMCQIHSECAGHPGSVSSQS